MDSDQTDNSLPRAYARKGIAMRIAKIFADELSKWKIATVAFVLISSILLSQPIYAQSCNSVDLTKCQMCGPILLCTGSDPANQESIPDSVLNSPDPNQFDGVQGIVASKILENWDVLYSVLENPNRIYLPRESFRLILEYPNAPASQVLQASQSEFQRYLFSLLPRVRVSRSADGTGGHRYEIQSTDQLMTFVLRLLGDAGAWLGVDLVSLYDEQGQSLAGVEGAMREADKRVYRAFLWGLEGVE